MPNKFFTLSLLILWAIASSCDDSDLQTAEDAAIAAYLGTLSNTPEPQEGGMYFMPIEQHSSKLAQSGDSVLVHATMRMLNQKTNGAYRQFFSTYPNSKLRLKLGSGGAPEFLPRALQQMHQGDSVVLVVPSALAYGSKAVGNVPAYTPILVNLKLVEIK